MSSTAITLDDYQGLIHSRARSWNRTTGLDPDECLSIASLGFVEASRVFREPREVSFVTYLWFCIDIEFKKFLQNNNGWAIPGSHPEFLDEIQGDPLEERRRDLYDRLMSLSDKALRVVLDVLKNPLEYAEQRTKSGKRYGYKPGLSKKIHSSLGYSWRDAEKIIEEITQMLREVGTTS